MTAIFTLRSSHSPRDLVQYVNGKVQRVVAFQNFAAEFPPRDLDALGERDFLFALEQRNLAHLRKVHADRIVGPFGGIFAFGGADFFFVLARPIAARGQVGETAFSLVGRRLVDDLDALLFERQQQADEHVRIVGVFRQGFEHL